MRVLATTLLGLLAAAPAAAQEPPPGFQTDLRGSPGVHAECFVIGEEITCALYGGRLVGQPRCDAGGPVPTVVWRARERPRRGHECIDEGFHGWRELREGARTRLGRYRCRSVLGVIAGRVVGHLECLAGEATGFRVDGNRGVNLDAAPLPRRTLRSCGSIAFTPNSDDGVSGIRAQRTTCRRARRVARASRDVRRRRYRAAGFACRGRRDDSQNLPTINWECVRGSRLIVFDRT